MLMRETSDYPPQRHRRPVFHLNISNVPNYINRMSYIVHWWYKQGESDLRSINHLGIKIFVIQKLFIVQHFTYNVQHFSFVLSGYKGHNSLYRHSSFVQAINQYCFVLSKHTHIYTHTVRTLYSPVLCSLNCRYITVCNLKRQSLRSIKAMERINKSREPHSSESTSLRSGIRQQTTQMHKQPAG